MDGWCFSHILAPSSSFTTIKIIINIKPTWAVQCGKNVKVRPFVVCGSSCEGANSDQWLPFQFKFCMNINVNNTNNWTLKSESDSPVKSIGWNTLQLAWEYVLTYPPWLFAIHWNPYIGSDVEMSKVICVTMFNLSAITS